MSSSDHMMPIKFTETIQNILKVVPDSPAYVQKCFVF